MTARRLSRRGFGLAARAVVGMAVVVLVLGVVAGCTNTGDVVSSSTTSGTSSTTAGSVSTSTTTSPSTSTTTLAIVASVGLGDPYFPKLGNAGYDVEHYSVALTVDPVGNTLTGEVVITATATDDLDVFSLDLAGLDVESVTVDDVEAPFARSEAKLVVDPDSLVPSGETFTVTVAYGGTPQPLESAVGYALGWRQTDGVIFVVSEPDGARTWLPCNDHPSDKAAFTFRITVPDGYTAAANGVLVDVEPGDGVETFVWDMPDPMATYLATVVVGDLVRVERPGPDGVVIRDYAPSTLDVGSLASVMQVGDMIGFFSGLFGPYPFAAYGHAFVPIDEGALEDQTLTLINQPLSAFKDDEDPTLFFLPNVVAHELAHQWFGDSVTPSTWQDVWLNEGFATYGEWLWDEHKWGSAVYDQQVEFSMGLLYGGPHPLLGDPGVADMFSPTVYQRGALTLHALRVAVGDDTFFEILRTWADRYAYANASTKDFIALAEEISGADLSGLFDEWLYQTTVPVLGEG